MEFYKNGQTENKTQIFDITEYGAVGDSKTVNTAYIQAAIDACTAGGAVYIPAGIYVSGALFLKSNMTLYLEKGAKLIGSNHTEDFPIMGYPYEGTDQLCYASLINTDSAPHKNITIDGSGTIDANGKALFEAELSDTHAKRGRAVCLRNTENVTIRGVTIRQSPAWCLHLIYCRNVLIDGVEIHSKYDENGNKYEMHNCDGIDIDSCKNVKIVNSLIASQDDCIAVKSGKDAEGRRVNIPSENITVQNCIFKSGFGVAMGSEMSGGIENVFVRDCRFEDTYSIASVKTTRGRGSYIKNIHYENCTIVNNSTEYGDTRWFRGALYVDGFYSHETFDLNAAAQIDEGTPVIDGIFFRDISVRTISGNVIYIAGLPEMPIKNVTMENITAHGKYGMKLYHIDGLVMKNITVTADEGEEIEKYHVR